MGLLDIIRDMQKQKEIAKTNLEKSSRTQKV